MLSLFAVSLAVLGLGQGSLAGVARAPAANFTADCLEIQLSVSGASQVFFPGSPEYANDTAHAFVSSSQNSTCSVEPGSAEDIAKIFSVISNRKTPWAVKSGGHALNQGWSSTLGVQIAMSRFNATSYDPTTKVATIGTGQKWEKVYAALAPFNVSVPGGRIADVGVGGFTLGGGYSWFANQVGLSIDNVVEFELVTPTGAILTVNSGTNPELFFGLKGGGNAFGIVTQLKLKTKPQGEVFGGLMVFNGDGVSTATDELLTFWNENNDPKASIGVVYGFDPSLNGTFISLFIFYDGPTPPENVFDGMLSIPAVSNAVKTGTLSDIASSLALPAPSSRGGYRSTSIRNYTMPLLQEAISQLEQFGPEAFNRSATTSSWAVEPLMNTTFQHNDGPSAYPHLPTNFLAPSVLTFEWMDASDDDWMVSTEKTMGDAIVAVANSEGQDLDLPDGILYPNYAAPDQGGRFLFGNNITTLRQIQQKYDPNDVNALTGGWKFTQ